MNAVPSALSVARSADSARRRDRVRQALAALAAGGHVVTVSSVARAARVHRSFIHRYPDLHGAVQEAQREPAKPSPAAPTSASLHTDLANLHAQNARLLGHVKLLDSTPGYAIRAGHQAYAQAVDGVLNAYIDQHFPNIPDPSEVEIQALASQIQGEAMGAIKDELSAVHLFYNHDAFYSFGYLLLTDLPEMAEGGVSTSRNFSSRITGLLDAGPARLPYDYQIDFHVTCAPDERPPDSCLPEYEVYRNATAELRRIDIEIQRITKGLGSASSEVRARLKRQLQELRTSRRPKALDLLDSAHQAYQLCGNDKLRLAAKDPDNGLKAARAARLARSTHGQVPVQATVAPTASL